MADDLKEVKDAITNNLRQNVDGNKQQDTRSIYSSFDLLLTTVEHMEGDVEQFLNIQDNFDRSVIHMLCTKSLNIFIFRNI